MLNGTRKYTDAQQVVGPHVARLADVGKQVLGVVDVEDGADADGTELVTGREG